MNKTTIISLIGMLTMFLMQAYWLTGLYVSRQEQCQSIIDEQLKVSIKKEITFRRGLGEIKDPKNPKLIIKFAKDMTPEEIASHKGDTIVLENASDKGIGDNLSDIFTQRMQDALLTGSPIQLQLLDSIFDQQLKESNIVTTSQLVLYNKNKESIDSTQLVIDKKHCLQTGFAPIGTQGLLFVKAFVEVPPHQILQHMLYSLVVSFLMSVIIFYCLYYQLVVIRKTRQALKQREQAVHSAIHDLKAPLNASYSVLDYITEKERDEALKSLLLSGKMQIRRLTETIESMLDTMKRETDTTVVNRTDVELSQLINRINKELQLLYPTKIYWVKLDKQLPYTSIYTDANRLERCLRNLIENALKYSDDGVEITIVLSEDNGRLSIAITDTGWGIPTEAQKKLGRQFYRAQHAGKTDPAGYGLGLCSVKLLLKELGGEFKFQSTEGVGSTFIIILPVKSKTQDGKQNSICGR